MMTLRMAWRNLARRRARTIVTIGLIGFSFALMLFNIHLLEGTLTQSVDEGVRMRYGHIVIVSPDFPDEQVLENSLHDPTRLMSIVRHIAPGADVTSRVLTTGTLRSADSVIMLDNLMGIDPQGERRLSRLHRKLVRGRWFAGERPEIVLGSLAARLLKVDLGDKLQLTVADVSGNITRIGLRVGGIFKTGGATADRGLAMVPITLLQRHTHMGDEVSQISIMWRHTQVDLLAGKLRRALRDHHVLVQTWEEALPSLAQLIAFKHGGNNIFLIIVFIIVAASILNTVLMSVLERTREFGVLLSLGSRPSTLFRLIMGEAWFMALIAIALGLAVGLSMSFALSVVGIDPKAIAGSEEAMEAGGIAFSERLYPSITVWSCVWTSLLMFCIVSASALWPALRAARILPVKAMRDL